MAVARDGTEAVADMPSTVEGESCRAPTVFGVGAQAGQRSAGQASLVEPDLAVAHRCGLGVVGRHDDHGADGGPGAQQLEDVGPGSRGRARRSARRRGGPASRPPAHGPRRRVAAGLRTAPRRGGPPTRRGRRRRGRRRPGRPTSAGAVPVASSGKAMFSWAVRTPASPFPCGIKRDPDPDAGAPVGDAGVVDRDLARPPAVTAPAIAHSSDDFPAPDGPVRARRVPGGTTRSTVVDRHQLPVAHRHPTGHHRPRLDVRLGDRRRGRIPGGGVPERPSARIALHRGVVGRARGAHTGSRQSRSGPPSRDEGPAVAVAVDADQRARRQVVEDVVRQGQRPVGRHDRILLAAPALATDPAVTDGDRPRQPGRDLGVVGDQDDRWCRPGGSPRAAGRGRGRAPRGRAGWSARRPAAGPGRVEMATASAVSCSRPGVSVSSGARATSVRPDQVEDLARGGHRAVRPREPAVWANATFSRASR